jgi:ribosomal protein S27E
MLNPIALLLQKLCAKCHALDIVVSTTNDDVNCNVCHGKTTIKKAGYLRTSITKTGDPIILTIEGKWL